MLGFTQDEVSPSSDEWFSRVRPDDVAMLRADIDAHRHGNTPSIEHEHRMRCWDGRYRWMLARGVAGREAGGGAAPRGGGRHPTPRREVPAPPPPRAPPFLPSTPPPPPPPLHPRPPPPPAVPR